MSKNKRKKTPAIGTKKESSLHRSLKFRYSGPGGETETMAGPYVCDARTGKGEYIEVQTGSFGPLREKAKAIAKTRKLRIIHPIVARKTIELRDEQGRLIRARKSPRKGSAWDLFSALLYAPEIPLYKRITIELAVVDAIEKRVDDGKGSWRRKGVSISDREIGAWHHSIILKNPKDYHIFAPFGKGEEFTVRGLAEKAGIDEALARKTLYVLAKIGVVERVGKQGRAFLYIKKGRANALPLLNPE